MLVSIVVLLLKIKSGVQKQNHCSFCFWVNVHKADEEKLSALTDKEGSDKDNNLKADTLTSSRRCRIERSLSWSFVWNDLCSFESSGLFPPKCLIIKSKSYPGALL